MKKGLLTTAILGLAVAAQASTPAPARSFAGLDGPLALVWSEEFDGETLDRDIWNVEVNGSGCGNHELQHYIDSPANVAVRDGNLVITARREQYGEHYFTSGRLNTHGKFSFTYGLVEARVKLPSTGDGLWPAVWFMGDDISDSGWPLCGETDLLEMGHADGIACGTQGKLFNGAVHYGTGNHEQKVGAHTSAYNLQDGNYHSFYLWWTPEHIAMYVDDVATPYLFIETGSSDDPSEAGYYFNKPNFLLLNLAVGGDFPGIHDPAAVTALRSDGAEASMLVDYIRIYLPSNQLITEK